MISFDAPSLALTPSGWAWESYVGAGSDPRAGSRVDFGI
jgi:hypothetical protein